MPHGATGRSPHAGTLALLAAVATMALAAAPQARFADTTAASGLDFVHTGLATGRDDMIASMGSGVCLADVDGNHYLDLYLVNAAAGQAQSPNGLYLNNGDSTFRQAAEAAGVAHRAQGMGCAFADYDNDGDPDLYVTNYGDSVLYRNNGDGTFSDVTAQAGVANAGRWGTSLAWGDYDQDGYLDLYVANYVDFARSVPGAFLNFPVKYYGSSDVLYRNNGNGTFSDTSLQAGIADDKRGLGAVFFDYDNDGDPDIYAANDGNPNTLYRNNGDGTFSDVTEQAGVGDPNSGMGIATGDYDDDGDLDIVVTNWLDQTNAFYRNNGDGTFSDVRHQLGLLDFGVGTVRWGTAFLDYDLDSRMDLVITSGMVPITDLAQAPQPTNLYWNPGNGQLLDFSYLAGLREYAPAIGRGLACGDLDNDGDTDLVILNNTGPAQILTNTGPSHHWLTVRLTGTTSNRDGIGARVRALIDGLWRTREIQSGASYMSGHDLAASFGLGNQLKVERLEVRWPSGTVQTLSNVAADQILTITEPSSDSGFRKR
ncbi:MAG: CRTAC1 family protein [Deinococcus sp.]|nr:CRTAC1 family protein [Deinococcus sp.]